VQLAIFSNVQGFDSTSKRDRELLTSTKRNIIYYIENEDVDRILLRLEVGFSTEIAKTILELRYKYEDLKFIVVTHSKDVLKGWSLQSRFDIEKVISEASNMYVSSDDKWIKDKSDYILTVD